MAYSEKTLTWLLIRKSLSHINKAGVNPIEFLIWSQVTDDDITTRYLWPLQDKDFNAVRRKLKFIETSFTPEAWKEESDEEDEKEEDLVLDAEQTNEELRSRDLDDEELQTEAFMQR